MMKDRYVSHWALLGYLLLIPRHRLQAGDFGILGDLSRIPRKDRSDKGIIRAKSRRELLLEGEAFITTLPSF